MINIMPFIQLDNKRKVYNNIPQEYKEELSLHLLHSNLYREVIMSFILLVIVFILMFVDMASMKSWGEHSHIYNHFSFLHLILIVVPSIFLIFVYYRKSIVLQNVKLCRILHRSINFLVLLLCAFISVYKEGADKLPYAYIIAMFCIGPTILLERKERFVIYLSSYLLYVTGFFISRPDMLSFIRNSFFFTLLVALALIVSHMHYSFFVNDFINNKIILDKNKELDNLYKDSKEALKRRTEELNETMEYEKLRVAFFANISHELRTPLTVIFSAEQMMDLIIERDAYMKGNKDIRQYMHVIRQNCYRLIRLVANLIDITKIDAGYFHFAPQNCDIVKVVEDITLSVAKFTEDRDINLVFDTDVEELELACDPDKIERIILNLLSNAVKFTPKGGDINVDIHEREETLEIHIKDTGIGIPENMLENIFDRFIQVDKTISRNHEGSGIGLSLVKSLVDLHGGTINLISEEGKGSEFIIGLPKRKILCDKKAGESNFDNDKHNVEKINIEFSDIYY